MVEVSRNDATAASIFINSVTESLADGATAHTSTKMKASIEATRPDTTKANAPPFLTRDCKDTLLQMQRTDPFCRHISK